MAFESANRQFSWPEDAAENAGAEGSTLVNKLVGQVLNGVAEDLKCASCLRTDTATASEAGSNGFRYWRGDCY